MAIAPPFLGNYKLLYDTIIGRDDQLYLHGIGLKPVTQQALLHASTSVHDLLPKTLFSNEEIRA